MRSRIHEPILLLFAVCLDLSMGSEARADEPDVKECVAANERSGPLRHQGRLREARAQLRLCSAPGCPSVVRDDCVSGATQLDAAVPSVIIAVQDAAGNDLTAVVVTLDDQMLTDKLDGKPLEVDPGEHVLRVEAAGMRPMEKRLLILEGERGRRERFSIGAPAPGPAAATPTAKATPALDIPAGGVRSSGGQRATGLVVGGVGILALGVGAVTGIMTFASWGSAKNACGVDFFPAHCQEPSQASSDRSTAVTTGAVSTVAFSAGGLALAAGAILFFTAPPGSSRARETIGIAPAFGASSAGVQVRGTFR